jgi:hypothetical protein
LLQTLGILTITANKKESLCITLNASSLLYEFQKVTQLWHLLRLTGSDDSTHDKLSSSIVLLKLLLAFVVVFSYLPLYQSAWDPPGGPCSLTYVCIFEYPLIKSFCLLSKKKKKESLLKTQVLV